MTTPTEKEWHVVTVGVEPEVKVFVAKKTPGRLEFMVEILRQPDDWPQLMRDRAAVIVSALNERAEREAK